MLIDFLKEKYPLLFSTNEMEPINLFGIECGPGWNSIVKNVCHLLYQKYKTAKRNYEHWAAKAEKNTDAQNKEQHITTFLDSAKRAYEASTENLPQICQIKEKFGTIRIYVENLSESNLDYVYGVIDMAELMSEVICEECGAPGKLYTQGWHKTLCLEHARQRYGDVQEEDLQQNE